MEEHKETNEPLELTQEQRLRDKKQSRSLITTFVVVLVVVIVLALGGWYFQSDSYEYSKFENAVAELEQDEQDSINKLIRQAESWEEKFNTDPKGDMVPHVEAARHWKSIGLVHGQEYGLVRSAQVYEKAFDVFGENNALLYNNAAGVYKELKDYDTAIDYYERAIVLAPGTSDYYIKLANMYRYHVDKGSEKVLEIYSRALDRLVIGVSTILKDRATYYEELGMYKESVIDWAKISALEPNNEPAFEEYERLLQVLEDMGEPIEELPTIEESKEGVIF